MKFINYMGANATGKSTRTFYLVKYLEENHDKQEIKMEIDGKNEPVGFLFSNGWFIVGRYAKNGEKWVSLDQDKFNDWKKRIEIFNEVIENYPVEVIFMEGYFGNRSKDYGPKKIFEKFPKVTEVEILVSFYSKPEEFLKRTNERSENSRDIEWAKNSSGWKDNSSFMQCFDLFSEEKTPDSHVAIVPFNGTKDYLVSRYFGEKYEIKNNVEEWV